MIERTLNFGPGKGLVGTLCMPSAPDAVNTDIGFVLFNSGVVHRIGPHRINVRFARRLARRGIPSLRFDLAGLGDSLRSDGRHSFAQQAVVDLRAAMDTVESATRAKRFVVFGFCSGAYHGYATAFADARIAGLVLFDAYLYPTFRARINRYLMRVKERGLLRAVSAWLASQNFSILPALSQSAKELRRTAPAIINTRLPRKADFAAGLRTLVQRGVAVRIIHTGGGFWHCNYRGQFFDAFKGFGMPDRVAADFFPDLDHVLTNLDGQAKVLTSIEKWAKEEFD